MNGVHTILYMLNLPKEIEGVIRRADQQCGMSREPGAPAEAGDGAAHTASPQLAQGPTSTLQTVTYYYTLNP